MRKKALSPAHRRAVAVQVVEVVEVVEVGMCSRRTACRILRLARSTYGYQGRPPANAMCCGQIGHYGVRTCWSGWRRR